jgi:hypothetical protein
LHLGLKPEDSGLLDFLLCRDAAQGSVGNPWLPVSSRCAGIAPGLTGAPQADAASPAAVFTLIAALVSRSWTVPQAVQVHCRTFRGLGPSLTPQVEQVCEVGSNRPILIRVRPCLAALYSSMLMNEDHPASCTDLASFVRASPATDRFSTAIPWFSEISFVESWWWNSRRASVTLAWARATFRRALARFLLPFCLRDSSFWTFFSFFSARRKKRGESIFVPSERTAK